MSNDQPVEAALIYYSVHADFVYFYAISRMKEHSNTEQAAIELIDEAERYSYDFEKIALSAIVSESKLTRPVSEIIINLSEPEFFSFLIQLTSRVNYYRKSASDILKEMDKDGEQQ